MTGRLAFAIFLLTAGLTGPIVRAEVPQVDACHAFTPDAAYIDTTILMQLEGRSVTLNVPRQYFEDRWDLRGGYTDTAQLFRVEIGSFDPVSRRETGERNREGIWNWMHFVVGDRIPLPAIAGIRATPFSREIPLNTHAMRSWDSGLTWLETPNASNRPEPLDDVFLYPADYEDMTTVIQCNSPQDPVIMNPMCVQNFRAAGLDVQLNYLRTELQHWAAFQDQVAAFLTCATSDQS